MLSKKIAAAVLLLGTAPILAACGGEDDSMEGHSGMGSSRTSDSAGAEETSGEFNEADIDFATSMIPHHRQAVEMAQLARSRAERPEVLALAEQIEAAQDPEIQTMTEWLESWGEPVPADMGGHDMSGSMPGMMTMEEMQQLAAAKGTEFDRLFLTMMIAHHQGAIEMAQTEKTEGQNEDAVALAEEIETAQQQEIADMQALLR